MGHMGMRNRHGDLGIVQRFVPIRHSLSVSQSLRSLCKNVFTYLILFGLPNREYLFSIFLKVFYVILIYFF